MGLCATCKWRGGKYSGTQTGMRSCELIEKNRQPRTVLTGGDDNYNFTFETSPKFGCTLYEEQKF